MSENQLQQPLPLAMFASPEALRETVCEWITCGKLPHGMSYSPNTESATGLNLLVVKVNYGNNSGILCTKGESAWVVWERPPPAEEKPKTIPAATGVKKSK